ncbi:MAG: hypothetical protein WEA04_00275 [Candidatus Andersenbacteria bacterium]
MKTWHQGVSIIAASLAAIALIIGSSVLPYGQRAVSQIENIHGVSYPVEDDLITVTEALAHFDVYLQEPVIAKKLHLTFDFIPFAEDHLGVGVRENSFWLSYEPQLFYQAGSSDKKTTALHSASLTIPLSDKIQERDRSIDVMFMAAPANHLPLPDPLTDTTYWQIKNLHATVEYDKPSTSAWRDFIRSIIRRERVL